MIEQSAEVVGTPTALRMRGDYIHPTTPEEQAAADLLVANGWSVREPSCPSCKGSGWTHRKKTRCPNGCWTLAEQEAWGESLQELGL